MVGLGYIGSLIKRVVAPPPPQYVNYSLGVGVCCFCIMRIFHYFQQIPMCAVPQSDLVRRRRSLSYTRFHPHATSKPDGLETIPLLT